MEIIVGSRESVLAVKQSQLVIDCIKKNNPSISVKLVTMKTTGDIILDKTLDKIGGKGLFVKELDKALKEEQVDITVHSFKDMPMEGDEELPIIAVSKREDPRDALVMPKGVSLAEIDFSKPIGCSSARRKIQLEQLYPSCIVKPIRGNVLTRLEKLDNGEFSAIILAVAGLNRLGLANRISRIFTPQEMLPAAGQGIMAVQARKSFDKSIVCEVNDIDAQDASNAERAYVKELDGGCSSPVAAYATVKGDELTLTGMYVDENGKSSKETTKGNRHEAKQIGQNLAIKMKQKSL